MGRWAGLALAAGLPAALSGRAAHSAQAHQEHSQGGTVFPWSHAAAGLAAFSLVQTLAFTCTIFSSLQLTKYSEHMSPRRGGSQCRVLLSALS